jgi:hypothetical protein
MPDPIGSPTLLKTTGIVLVAPWAALAAAVPKPAIITSGFDLTRSAAIFGRISNSPCAERKSKIRFLPSSYPSSSRRFFTIVASLVPAKARYAIRYVLDACRARAASGRAPANPPTSLMKSRRLTACFKVHNIELQHAAYRAPAGLVSVDDVALGHKRRFGATPAMSPMPPTTEVGVTPRDRRPVP